MTWIDHTKFYGAGKNCGIDESVFYNMNNPLRITRTKRPVLQNFSGPYPDMTNKNNLRSIKTRPQALARNLKNSSSYRCQIDKTRNLSSQKLPLHCTNTNLYQDVTNRALRQFPIKCSHTFSDHKSTRDISDASNNESSPHHNKPLKISYSHDKFNYNNNCLVSKDLQARKDKILKTNRIKPEDFLTNLRIFDSFPDKIDTAEIFNSDIIEEENSIKIDLGNSIIHENDPIASLVPEDLQALEEKLLNTNRTKPEDLLMDMRNLELFLEKMETAEIFNADENEVREEENSLEIEPPDPMIQTIQQNINENKDTEKPIRVINKIENTIYRIGDHVLLKCSQSHPKWQRGFVTAIAEPDICDVKTMDGKTHKLSVNQLFKTRLPGEKTAEIYSIDTEVEDVDENFMRHVVIPPPEEWADIIGI